MKYCIRLLIYCICTAELKWVNLICSLESSITFHNVHESCGIDTGVRNTSITITNSKGNMQTRVYIGWIEIACDIYKY